MCTLIGKVRGEHIIVLYGFGCCRSVEEIEEIYPKISAKNGWEEIYVGDLEYGHFLPKWAGWLTSEAQSQLPAELSKKVKGYKTVIYYTFNEDLPTANSKGSIAELIHRNQSIYFSSLEQIIAFKKFIVSSNRNPFDFAPHENFLSAIPKVFISKSARMAVSKKAQKLIEQFDSISKLHR